MNDRLMWIMMAGVSGFLLAGPAVFFTFVLSGATAGVGVVLAFAFVFVSLYMLAVRHADGG